MTERISDVTRGDRFVWRGFVFIQVTRVARDGTWADIRCRELGLEWSKRQWLPLPEGTLREEEVER